VDEQLDVAAVRGDMGGRDLVEGRQWIDSHGGSFGGVCEPTIPSRGMRSPLAALKLP
jgi:hypothetical protein